MIIAQPQGPLWDTGPPSEDTHSNGKSPHRDLCLHSGICSRAHTVVPNTAGWRWPLFPSSPMLLARGGLGPPESGWPESFAGRGPRRSASARAASSPARGDRRRQMSCSSSARGCSCPMSLSLWCTAACRLWTVASEVSSCSRRVAISLAGRQDMQLWYRGTRDSPLPTPNLEAPHHSHNKSHAPHHCLKASPCYRLNVCVLPRFIC